MADPQPVKILVLPESEVESIRARLDRLENRPSSPCAFCRDRPDGLWYTDHTVGAARHVWRKGWCSEPIDPCAMHYNGKGEHVGACQRWRTLESLRPGAVFETKNGVRAVKMDSGNVKSCPPEHGSSVHWHINVVTHAGEMTTMCPNIIVREIPLP